MSGSALPLTTTRAPSSAFAFSEASAKISRWEPLEPVSNTQPGSTPALTVPVMVWAPAAVGPPLVGVGRSVAGGGAMDGAGDEGSADTGAEEREGAPAGEGSSVRAHPAVTRAATRAANTIGRLIFMAVRRYGTRAGSRQRAGDEEERSDRRRNGPIREDTHVVRRDLPPPRAVV